MPPIAGLATRTPLQIDPLLLPQFLGNLLQWVIDVMGTIGPVGAGLLIALENVFPPLPSELILPLAGATAASGQFTIVEAIVWTTAGSVAGAFVLYLLGAWLGSDRTGRLIAKIPLMSYSDYTRSRAWFDKHGGKAIFFGRMIPMFRSFISVPAGVARTPLLKFGLLTAAGSLIWNSIFVIAGYKLGENWEVVQDYAGIFSNVVVVVVVILVVWFVVGRVRKYRAAKATPARATTGDNSTDGSSGAGTADSSGD